MKPINSHYAETDPSDKDVARCKNCHEEQDAVIEWGEDVCKNCGYENED